MIIQETKYWYNMTLAILQICGIYFQGNLVRGRHPVGVEWSCIRGIDLHLWNHILNHIIKSSKTNFKISPCRLNQKQFDLNMIEKKYFYVQYVG